MLNRMGTSPDTPSSFTGQPSCRMFNKGEAIASNDLPFIGEASGTQYTGLMDAPSHTLDFLVAYHTLVSISICQFLNSC